jgi:TonB-linked SusC/RagA family outer membrane protein
MVPLAFAQSGSITGTVTDSQSGSPLPATNIYIPDLERGASTDTNGEFTISNVPAGTYTVRATFIGYSDNNQQVEVSSGETTANFELQSASANLDELVVVGFGEQSRRKIVGSVSSIDTEKITSSNINTLDKALQGQTAGVQVTSASGVLGAPVSVRVRGTTSINASSQPLYVVDGVPLVSNEIGANLGVGGDGGTNPLINLNPNDIKSIEVLKDASAAAVYGARGANGVVLITTKSGQAGKTQIELGTSIGYSNPTEKYDIFTGREYAEVYNYRSGEVFGGEGPFPSPEEVPNTDWADLVTRTGTVQNYNASVSGGSSETQFYISGKYSTEEGYADPNALQRYNAQAKIDHSFNDKLDLGLSVNPSRSENSRISTSNLVSAPYTYAALIAPVVPQFYENGEINDASDAARAPTNALSGFNGTPYANAVGIDRAQTVTQINTNADVDYDFLPQLTASTQFSVQYLQTEEEFKQSDFSTDGFPLGGGSASNEQFLNYSWRNTLNYTNDWEDHSLTALVGVTFQKADQTSINVDGDTFLSNNLPNLNSAANITGGGGFGSSYAFQNNLARLSYTFKDRYILTLTGSYNGSSRFGDDNRYGFFPAVAAGWVISDEAFAQADALSFLKLRGSYGITGNANIDNFAQLGLLQGGFNYNNLPGVTVSQLASPGLSWEETAQLDLGIDYGFVDNRIRGSVGYYQKSTDKLLLDVPISATNGFDSFIQNIGAIKNSGFEFDISADIVTGSFNWSVNANISTLNNEVESIPSEFVEGENLVREGEALGSFFVREYAGVNPDNGDALYFLNDEATQAQLDDGTVFTIGKFGDRQVTNNVNVAARKILGNPFADFFGGFGTRVAFKGVDFSMNFQYNQGNEIYWSDGEFVATNLSSIFNQNRSQLDYWTSDNPNASVPEPRVGGNGNSPSSRYLEDGSYIRLKSLDIGYTIPRDLINGYNLRIYAQGTNLLTFTDFRGLDPEVTPNTSDNVNQGNVFFQLPQSRTILFGIELGL